MKPHHYRKTLLAWCLPSASLAVAPLLSAQATECMNLRPDGQALWAADATSCSISADGQVVAFATPSQYLVPGAPSHSLIYVRDRVTGVLSIASVNSLGQPASSAALDALISADGQHVAFSSSAPNLTPLAPPPAVQAWVHDRVTGRTSLVSVDAAGNPADADSRVSSISADGRFVAFETAAALVPSDTNLRSDVYVRDTLTARTARISVSTGGAQSAGICRDGKLSADGRRVVFVAEADDLASGDNNGFADALLRDLVTGTTTLVSVATGGTSANAPIRRVGISGDGDTVLFVSAAATLDPALGGNVRPHIFARQLSTGVTRMLDVSITGGLSSGLVANTDRSDAPRCSFDGRFVVFGHSGSDLVPGDTNTAPDVFLVDRSTGAVSRPSLGSCGQQQDYDIGTSRTSAGLSDDATCVVFTSPAENLVVGDSSSFEWYDVFVRDTTKPALGFALCTRDSGAPCVCASPYYPERGCPNGNEATGLFASGEASVSADTLRLGAYELPSTANLCVLVQGLQPLAGMAGLPAGDGVGCIARPLVRLVSGPPNLGEAFFYPTLGDTPLSQLGAPPVPGTTVYYQVWHTSSQPLCTPASFNLSNAVAILWRP